jgi:putative aminopeptidase FrvX
MDAPALDLLKSLLATPTPSGWELNGLSQLAAYLKPHVPNLSYDLHGNLRAVLNPSAPLRVMIEGHCDEIGFMVQYVDDQGFLYMTALGGVTIPLLAGERIVIQGRKGPVNGVFGVRPPHLMKPSEREKVAPQELTDIAVDIGAANKTEAMEWVELGSPAVIDAGWRPLAGTRVSCRGFDNRIGAFIVTEAMRRLAGPALPIAVHMVASVQEELGLVGATTAAFDVQPHAGICVDVGFASDTPGNDKKLVGDIALGKGPIVCFGPTYNPKLHALIERSAADQAIPIQRQVRARGSSTNAWAIRLARSGAAAGLISIPLRYMHSAVETLCLSDVEQSIALLCAALQAIPADMTFAPAQP